MSLLTQLVLSHLLIVPSLAEDLSSRRYDALLSAKCKARCLVEYRTAPLLSWPSTWQRCPRLSACSSCLLPCDLDPSLLQTCLAICSTVGTRNDESLSSDDCQRSCQFVARLYDDRPNVTDVRVTNLSAVTRKSRRTVRLKWRAEGMTSLEPVFYVIEAQWTLPSNASDPNEQWISAWGFVKEEVSRSKSIIRHLQRDQRAYFFRVAAVTRQGSSAFVQTNIPLQLSERSSLSLVLVDPSLLIEEEQSLPMVLSPSSSLFNVRFFLPVVSSLVVQFV